MKKNTNDDKASYKDWNGELINRQITELNFSDYIQVIAQSDWDEFDYNELDRGSFLSHLETIRTIRNKIAHYSPDPLASTERHSLKVTADLLLKMCSDSSD